MTSGPATAGAGPEPTAVGDVLVRLAGERSHLLVIASEDIGVAASFAEVWPERVLTIEPLQTRLSVAQGIVAGGGEAVVVLEPSVDTLPLRGDTGVVVLSATPAHLHLAFRSGLQVCQPGWRADVAALLVGALGMSSVTTLLTAPVFAAGKGQVDAPPPTTIDARRVLQRGGDGLVLGSGPTAPIARQVATELLRRQVEVTAVDLHTITAASGLDASLFTTHVLVGPAGAPRAAAFDAVDATVPSAELVGAVQRTLAAAQRTLSAQPTSKRH